MHPLNVIVCGESVTEVDALIAAVIGKASVAVPDDNVLTALDDPSCASIAPGVTIGEAYGKPPTLRVPLDRAKAFPHGASMLAQLGAGPNDVLGPDDNQLVVHMYHAKEASLLLQTTVHPHVLVVCFSPWLPASFDRLSASWISTIDRLYPRPPLILCGTRSECLGVRAIEKYLAEHDVQPVDEEDICDMSLRWRCVHYVEVSAALAVNTSVLEDSILKAAFGEPEKRVLPEAVMAMRKGCIHAARQRQAVWSWKRHPKSNRLFYYNRVTKAKQYQRPGDYDGDEPEFTREERLDEEQRKLAEEELRLQQERDVADVELTRRELQEYEARMTEKTHRHTILTSETNRLQVALDAIRDNQQANINERQRLERQKEELGHEESNFSKSTVDVDREMDAKLEIAKSKMFQLEAVAALRAEERYAGDISEVLVANSGLASAIRDMLQEEVAVQQQGGIALSAFDVARKRLDEATIELAAMDAPTQNAAQQLRTIKAETVQLQRRLVGLQTELATLNNAAKSVDRDAMARHERSVALRQHLEELDKDIASQRAQLRETTRDDVEMQELRRLGLVREGLIRQLATTASNVAGAEVATMKYKVHLTYLYSEFERVSTTLLDLYRNHAAEASSLRDQLLSTDAYSPVAAAGLCYSIEAIEREALDLGHATNDTKKGSYYRTGDDDATKANSTKGRRLDAAASAHARSVMSREAKEMAEVFDAKVKASKLADAAAKRAVVASTRYNRIVQTIAMQRVELQEAIAMAQEALERYMPPSADIAHKGQPTTIQGAGSALLHERAPLDRLRSVVAPIVDHDARLMQLLIDTFTAEVLSKVVVKEGVADGRRAQGDHLSLGALRQARSDARKAEAASTAEYQRLVAATQRRMHDTQDGSLPRTAR